MKIFRNIAAIVIGVSVYIFLEYILVYVVGFLVSVPILSQFMRGFIVPSRLFIAVTVPSIAIPLTLATVSAISDYENVNYSGIIVFGILIAITVFVFVSNIIYNGFEWINLVSALINSGFFIYGIA